MVSSDFLPFFTTMSGVGATLFGLIFVVISIRPEVMSPETTTARRQVQAASSYTALINPLIISLLALLPHATIVTVTLVMSTVGLVNTLFMGQFLLHDLRAIVKQYSSVLLILSGLALFGFEMVYGIQLDRTPGDTGVMANLATILVLMYIYGIARAWDLVGVRQFHLADVLNPLLAHHKVEADEKPGARKQ